MFTCPECEREPMESISSWKRHMTSSHGGYTADQLTAASGGDNEGTQIAGGSLEDAIANLPMSEDEIGQEERQSPESKKATKAARKRIRAKFEALRKKVATDIPAQAFTAAGLELPQEDATWIGESIELALEVFGVEFEVEPKNLVIRNPFIILIYPIFVVLAVVAKAYLTKKAEQDTENAE